MRSLSGVVPGTLFCYPGNTGTWWYLLGMFCCMLQTHGGELHSQLLWSPAWHLNTTPTHTQQREVHREMGLCLTVLCFLQGGREVSDFISYLKREATNTPVLQEEDKTKKSKKKAKEDL